MCVCVCVYVYVWLTLYVCMYVCVCVCVVTQRVVRSQKDKRYDQMQNTIRTMKNHIKINDWKAITAGLLY